MVIACMFLGRPVPAVASFKKMWTVDSHRRLVFESLSTTMVLRLDLTVYSRHHEHGQSGVVTDALERQM